MKLLQNMGYFEGKFYCLFFMIQFIVTYVIELRIINNNQSILIW